MQGIYPATVNRLRTPKTKKHSGFGVLRGGVVSPDIFSNEFIKDMDILTELYKVLKK